MPYNYAEAFEDHAICLRCQDEIIAAAILAYRTDHPGVQGEVQLRILLEQKTVEIIGEDVVYFTFRELGITTVC